MKKQRIKRLYVAPAFILSIESGNCGKIRMVWTGIHQWKAKTYLGLRLMSLHCRDIQMEENITLPDSEYPGAQRVTLHIGGTDEDPK